MKQQKGIILLTTMVFLSLITLLLLAQAELLFLNYKEFNHYTKQVSILHALETVASNLIREQKGQSECLSKKLNPNRAILLVKTKKKGCFITDDKLTYSYLIEDLGQFHCHIVTVNGKEYSTKHWRLTLAVLNSQSFILQLRYITLATRMPSTCKTRIHLPTGILSWRYLI